MAIKIENETTGKLPANVNAQINKALSVLPREHLRGIERLRLVESISDPRARPSAGAPIPGLYHPRQAGHPAWIEVSAASLLSPQNGWRGRVISRLSFKSNLAMLIFSLIAQHYYLTFRHSTKRTQLEPLVRTYIEQHMKKWSEQENSLRTRLFRPFQPTLEKWARALHRKAKKSRKT